MNGMDMMIAGWALSVTGLMIDLTFRKRRMMKKLLRTGFTKVGEVYKGEFTLLQGEDAVNVLYAFVHKGEVMYVGETSNKDGFGKRMSQYEKPYKSQSTNMKVNAKLKELDVVEIYMMEEVTSLSYGEFQIKLSKGLECSIIKELQPKWNKRGK